MLSALRDMIATEMQIVASSASVAMIHGIVMDEAVVSVVVTDPMRVARMDTSRTRVRCAHRCAAKAACWLVPAFASIRASGWPAGRPK